MPEGQAASSGIDRSSLTTESQPVAGLPRFLSDAIGGVQEHAELCVSTTRPTHTKIDCARL